MKALWLALITSISLSYLDAPTSASSTPAEAASQTHRSCELVDEYSRRIHFELLGVENRIREPETSKDSADGFRLAFDREARSVALMQKSSPACKDGKILNLAAARIMDGEVLIARYRRTDWEPKLNRAIQQYTFCLVQFFGDERGKECQTRQDQLMKYKVAWEAADLR